MSRLVRVSYIAVESLRIPRCAIRWRSILTQDALVDARRLKRQCRRARDKGWLDYVTGIRPHTRRA